MMYHDEQQFEQDLTPQERQIEALLADALSITPPAGLSNRTLTASLLELHQAADEALEADVQHALSLPVPDGLSARIYANSVDYLHDEQPFSIATIHQSVAWRQVALAACVVFAVLVAIRFGSQSPEPTQLQPTELHVASNNVLSAEDEELLFEDLNLSDYAYLTDTRELAFADVAIGLDSMRSDIELWQYGLLTD